MRLPCAVSQLQAQCRASGYISAWQVTRSPDIKACRPDANGSRVLTIRVARSYPNGLLACARNSCYIFGMFESCGAASILGDLSQEEFIVWAGFVQAHAAIARGLDADLRAAHGLALNEFEILLWLSHESCTRMRMAELADTVQLSPSGLSRAVERLEARGLVTRHRFADDRRGAFAKLTESGVDLLQRAGATQAAGIRRRFLERLTAEELRAFGPAWMRVLEAIERSCPWSGSSPAEAPLTSCPCADDAIHDEQREGSR